MVILVVGATGKTGRHVVRQLLDRAEPVRAHLHSAARADDVPYGAELVVADLDAAEEWDAAVSGCDRIYLASPAGPGQRRQEGAVIAAAQRSGVEPHVVKVAAMGLDDPTAGRIALQHSHIRADLDASGLPWTTLALSQLMDNVMLYLTPVEELGVLPVPAGDARIAWVDAADVAAVAVGVLTTSGHEGRTYDVTGPDPLHHSEVAALLGDALGRPVRYADVAPRQAVHAMVAAGLPEWVAAGVVETNQWYAAGGAAHPTDVVATIGQRQPRTLSDFVTARLAPIPSRRQP